MRGSSVPPGLPGAAAPSVVTRSTLPPREVGSCGTELRALSPVPTHRCPSGPNRGRQPEWRPLLMAGSPVTMSVRLASGVYPASTGQRTIRTPRVPPASDRKQG